MGKYSDILLTADYDRTLTAPDGSIPAANLEAIRYFMAEGGAFTVNTGRSLPMSQIVLKQIPVNAPLLLYNGSAAYDSATGEISACTMIPMDMWETVREVMALVPDLMLEVQGVDAHYRFVECPGWDAFYEFNRVSHRAAEEGQDLGPFLKFSIYTGFEQLSVGHLFEADDREIARMDEAEALLREKLGDKCEIFRAGAKILDIHAKGVSKGRSARALQKSLGRKILVCVGDAENDLPMLEEADFAFCPADGAVAERFPNVCKCALGSVADTIYKEIPKIAKKLLDNMA